jgi:transcriptional regulator with XRE-family HTH domain
MELSTPHIGRKIQRIRELRGIKQEVLASELGLSQSAVANMERSDIIEEDKLQKLADVLGVSPEAIKNFNEEALVFHIQNMHDQATAYAYNFQCNYNPLDKVVELYERLLESEREKARLAADKKKDK